jgi:hypothetical protein
MGPSKCTLHQKKERRKKERKKGTTEGKYKIKLERLQERQRGKR